MSGQNDTPTPPAQPDGTAHPEAVEKHSRWPGWIWSIPLAALVIVGYLGFQQLATTGPSVTVTFPIAGGIKANQTNVEYQGADVGRTTAASASRCSSMRRITS